VAGRKRLSFAEDFRRFFLRGLGLVLPPVLTVWILVQVWLLLNSYVGEPVNTALRYIVAWSIADVHRTPPKTDLEAYRHIAPLNVWVPAKVAWVVAGREPLEALPVRPAERDQLLARSIEAGEFPLSVAELYERYIYYQYYVPGHLSFVGLIVALVGVYFAGRFLATVVGAWTWSLTERAILGLPLVRSVYPHVKQFVEFLLSDRSREYNRVVAVEYPRKGIWSLGLVTGDGIQALEEATGQEFITVFVPYTPWSVAGYAIELPKSDVVDLNMSVDEAIRFVVTGGVLRPGFSPLTATVDKLRKEAEVVSSRRKLPKRQRPLRVGTRGSVLARTQTESVVRMLKQLWPELAVEVIEIRTAGDVHAERKLSEIGGEGVFTKELQRALLDGRIDLAVHSYKDLPTTPVSGLRVAAVPPRATPWDVLVTRPPAQTIHTLPKGATVGTSSLRRRVQLQRLRSDLRFVELRGNVGTRLRKLDEAVDGIDAVVLAYAGLERLGLVRRISYVFLPHELLPAAAQGALAIECRADDQEVLQIVSPLDHPPTRAAVEAERAVLRTLGGGCHVPVGAIGIAAGDELRLSAGVFAEGCRSVVAELSGPASDAVALGERLAQKLLERGARELL